MNIFLQMPQGWDYSLIIAQTALAISVLTTWHDGFFSLIKKAIIVCSDLQERDSGRIYAQNLYTSKQNRICQFFRKPIIFCFNNLFDDKILLKLKFLMKIVSLGLVLFFIVYCYCQTQKGSTSSLEIQWTYLAWLPFFIWFSLLIFSLFLNIGILLLNIDSRIETKAWLNFHKEKIETSPSSYKKGKSGNLILGIILYITFFVLLIPIIIIELGLIPICLFFGLFLFIDKILSRLLFLSRLKNWIDSLCAHKPACPLCNQTDTCNKGNCNMCHSNANPLIFDKKEVNQNNFENISDSSITQPLTITAPCPKEGYQIVCTISCNSVKESNT